MANNVIRPHLLLLLAALASPSLAQQAQGVPEKGPARESKTGNQAERQQYPTEDAPLPIRVIESPSDESDRKRREDDAAKHEGADLKAQERSALAAEQQVGVGTAMAWLSLAGLLALIWTLSETRRASSAATRAAVAAEKTLAHSTNSAEKQLRAYVWRESNSAAGFIHDPVTGQVTAAFSIRNSGQTPAHDVQCWSKFEVLNYIQLAPLAYEFEQAPKELFSTKFVINPGSTHTFSDVRSMSSQEWTNICARDSVLVIWGEIRYLDVFKVERKTFFRLRLDEREHGTEYIWAYCSLGNHAT